MADQGAGRRPETRTLTASAATMRRLAPPATLVVAALVLVGCGPGGGSGGVGSPCETRADCADGLICLDGVCAEIGDGGPDADTGCLSDRDCPDGHTCDLESGRCLEPSSGCVPGTVVCEGGVLYECREDSTHVLHACPSGRCEAGLCACDAEGGCLAGESCEDGACRCGSGTWCESPRVCCDADEICLDTVSCDEDGHCSFATRCAPRCDGAVRCGEGGQLCCAGATPVCGPLDTCVPDCGETMLCGEAFDRCCGAGELCSFGRCFPLGDPCTRFTDCDFGEYCEPTLGRCVADEFPDDIDCRRPGDFLDFTPELRWHWPGVEIGGSLYVHVAATPMVADLTGDGTPNVAFPAYRTGGEGAAALVVLDGSSGATVYHNTTHPLQAWSPVALADVDGDGNVEIVVSSQAGVGLVESLAVCPDPAADPSGCYRWHRSFSAELGVIVADMRGDGTRQVVFQRTVLDANDGSTIAALAAGSQYPSVADLTGDGRLELLSAGCAYRLTDADALEQVWCTPGVSGSVFSAVGDVVRGARAGRPEVIWVGGGRVRIAAGETGEVLHDWALPGGGGGGPPTVADFDGDGGGEVGVAGSGCYTVFDTDCLGDPGADAPGCARPSIPPCTRGVDCFEVEACPDVAATGGTGDGILWSVYAQDISSSRTGSSVFDFQGDGRNEVVYNDECLLMVLDGSTGAPQFRVPNTSRTASEYPVVVDVTGDGQTNIVVPANSDQFARDCARPMGAAPPSGERIHRPDRYPECWAADPPVWCTAGTAGMFAYQDSEDRWVRTRRIWNQFAYYIDNVRDDATVPAAPGRNWETHNTFRANRQGEVPLNASDPRGEEIRVFVDECPVRIRFAALISNRGTRSIPAGLPVTLYRTDGAAPVWVATVLTTEPIFPGGVLVVTFAYDLEASDQDSTMAFRIAANDDGTGTGVDFDCNPDAAARDVEGIRCEGVL